uniref:Reverse transcriptase domain-containing protein n=1 Tax=Cajanus cajan TaxID=3821 RepID=A0A151UI01_CAJCA
MGRNVLALIGKSVPHIPEKCKDPGTFCIPCIIGNSKFENARLNLGASINVMPLSIFKSLSLGPLPPTGVVIQLANRSVAHPTDFVEDVLVRVGELIFPVDFYVLDMEEGFFHGSAPIILGRPFLKIARTKIDVYARTLSMEFGDIVVHFNILDAMKFPSEAHSVFRAKLIDDLVDEHIHDFDSFHVKKHSFLSELYNCLSCIKSEFEFGSDLDCDDASEFDTLGVVPLVLDFIESECINHVAGSTK